MVNRDAPVDTVSLALQLGATYVARSFSGDKNQLVPLIKGALAHQGTAFIDVISPCLAFNNHDGGARGTAMSAASWTASHRRSILFLLLLLALGGAVSALKLPVALFPHVDFPRIVVAQFVDMRALRAQRS